MSPKVSACLNQWTILHINNIVKMTSQQMNLRKNWGLLFYLKLFLCYVTLILCLVCLSVEDDLKMTMILYSNQLTMDIYNINWNIRIKFSKKKTLK